MAYPVWPLSLPQCIQMEGFSNGGEQPLRRQQMETGLDRVTRVSSTSVRSNSYSINCTEEQLADFWSFYEGAADGGAALVIMPMMTANKVLMHVCRFLNYPTISRSGIKWRVTFSLETAQQQINWS